jgi:hypothetical protein
MGIPRESDPVWRSIVSGERAIQFESLPLRMFMTRVYLRVRADRSPAVIAQCAAELCDLVQKNANLPTVQKDAAKLG